MATALKSPVVVESARVPQRGPYFKTNCFLAVPVVQLPRGLLFSIEAVAV